MGSDIGECHPVGSGIKNKDKAGRHIRRNGGKIGSRNEDKG